jgi:hypothetical protein
VAALPVGEVGTYLPRNSTSLASDQNPCTDERATHVVRVVIASQILWVHGRRGDSKPVGRREGFPLPRDRGEEILGASGLAPGRFHPERYSRRERTAAHAFPLISTKFTSTPRSVLRIERIPWDRARGVLALDQYPWKQSVCHQVLGNVAEDELLHTGPATRFGSGIASHPGPVAGTSMIVGSSAVREAGFDPLVKHTNRGQWEDNPFTPEARTT